MTKTLYRAGLLLLTATSLLAQKARSITGAVTDQATKTPLSGALVQLQNASVNTSVRSDEVGAYRLLAPAGVYQMTVRRIGYAPFTKQVTLPDQDAEIGIELVALPQGLAPVRVGAKGAGIWGIVESGSLDRPMPYAKVQLAGAKKDVLTDSAGAFFLDVKPGRYLLRIGRNGYATETFMIDVAKNQVVDASMILDKSDSPPNPGLDGLWQDLDERLIWRGMNSAVLSGAELRQANAQLDYAIGSSPSVISKGLHLDRSVCIFENGVPRPGFGLEQYRVEDIEAIEVYSNGDDAGHLLAQSWPRGANCSPSTNRSPTRGGTSLKWVSIWTKRR